jgi:bla regulator protein BlaR1
MSSLFDINGSTLLSGVVLLSFKGSIIIALVLLIQRLARPWLSAQARYWLWMPALFCLFIPFGIGTSWSPFTSLTATPPPTPIAELPAAIATAEPLPEPVINPLVILWACCAVALAAIVMYNVFRYFRIQTRARNIHDTVQSNLNECKGELQIRRTVRVLESAEVDTPSVYGWLKPAIVLPKGLARDLDPDELNFVLLHELAHVKRHDIALNWIITLVQILHWFNPVVWYGFHRMRRDHEIACDARVLRQLPPHQHAAYGHTLISLMERFPRAYQFSQGLGIVGNTKRMKERLHMIKQYKTFRKRHIAVGAASLIAVALLAFSENQAGAHDGPLDQVEADKGSIQTKLREIRDRIEHIDLRILHDHLRDVHEHGTPEMKDRLHDSFDIVHEHGTNDEQEVVLRHRDELEKREYKERALQEKEKTSRVEREYKTRVEKLSSDGHQITDKIIAHSATEDTRINTDKREGRVIRDLRELQDEQLRAVHRDHEIAAQREKSAVRDEVERMHRHEENPAKAETNKKLQVDLRTKLQKEMKVLEDEKARVRDLQARLELETIVLKERAARLQDMKERLDQEEKIQSGSRNVSIN